MLKFHSFFVFLHFVEKAKKTIVSLRSNTLRKIFLEQRLFRIELILNTFPSILMLSLLDFNISQNECKFIFDFGQNYNNIRIFKTPKEQ